jgi:hypothetical protein
MIHAELGRLLDDPVHLVGLGQSLDEAQGEARLAPGLAQGAHLHVDAVAVDAGDRGVVFAATAVEDDERVAGLQAPTCASPALRRSDFATCWAASGSSENCAPGPRRRSQ